MTWRSGRWIGPTTPTTWERPAHCRSVRRPLWQTALTSTTSADTTTGALNTYQWCYFLDRTFGNNTANQYYVQAYGTMTVRGPVTRQGMTAYTIQSMTGVRTFTNISSGVSSTNPILYLQFENRDEQYGGGGGLTYWTINDNIVFQSSPYLTTEGFIYSTFPTPNLPQFGYGAAATNDIQVNVNQTFRNNAFMALQENAVGTEDSNTDLPSGFSISGRYGFQFTQGGLSSTSQCSAQSSNFKYPTITTYSFCYVINGTALTGQTFTISSSGTLSVYNVPVTSTLQYSDTATIVAGITGYRLYTDNIGNNSFITITGLASNAFAQDGWNYDQLMYNNSNIFDAYGVLYTFSGQAQSPSGYVYGDVASPAINIFNDGTGFQEEGWVGQFATAYDWGGAGGGFGIYRQVADGGSSYNTGGLLRGSCGYSGAIPAGFGPNAATTNNGGGGGSSGLSGGAIAGIVIGSVVGAALLLLLCLCAAGLLGGRKNKSAEDSVSKPSGGYRTQNEESRTGETSQVELHTHGETVPDNV